MEYEYKPTDYEIKLIILYTVKSLKTGASYTILDYVISSSANVNYFELEQYIQGLIQSGNLSELTLEGENVFSITDSGEETLSFFEHKIPGSIKIRLDDKINEVNRKEMSGNKFFADFVPISENEYTVKCSMEENGIPLIKLEFYAGSKRNAMAICNYLKENTEDFYKKFTSVITEGIK